MAGVIVQCPVCGMQLYEPPGAPYFTCVCGTTLQSSSAPPAPSVAPHPVPQTNGHSSHQHLTHTNSRPHSASTEPPDMSNLSLNGRPNSASSTGSQPPPPSFPPPQQQMHQCSTCGGFLHLPENLPRDKQGNRLVRCGSCQSVNRFPDPEPESSVYNAPPPGPVHDQVKYPPPSPPKQVEAPPQRKEEFQPAQGRRPFAFEHQSQAPEPTKMSEGPSAAVMEQQQTYAAPGYDTFAPAGYTPPPPEPSTYPQGPPPLPPQQDQFASVQGPQSGLTPPPYFHQSSLPAPHPPQYGGPQASLPSKFHGVGPVQPGWYPGGFGPPSVPAPPPIAPVEKKKKKGLFGKMRKAFEDEDEFERDVKINGFPVPDAQVKKAELRSGSLQPGDYWYDVRAGFWGLIDGPCLGIIPAGIHELVRNKKSEENGGSGVNELQRHFSGGTTGVIINGRELTPRDLAVLRGRGVSEEPRAYCLDINGSLTDAVTMQPLIQLGHLATSLAQGQRGIGMRIPDEELRRRKLEEVKKALQEQEERRPIVARVSSG